MGVYNFIVYIVVCLPFGVAIVCGSIFFIFYLLESVRAMDVCVFTIYLYIVGFN